MITINMLCRSDPNRNRYTLELITYNTSHHSEHRVKHQQVITDDFLTAFIFVQVDTISINQHFCLKFYLSNRGHTEVQRLEPVYL